MLAYNPYENLEESVEMVQSFRGLLEKEMKELTERQQYQQPLPGDLKNRLVIKLTHLRNASRRLKQELNGMKHYVEKTRIEAVLALKDVGMLKREEKAHSVTISQLKRLTVPVPEGEDKENRANNQSKAYENAKKASSKERRHYSQAFIPIVHSEFDQTKQLPKREHKPIAEAPVLAPVNEESMSSLKDLRSNIYMELEELRRIEQREKVVRNLNDSRHRSVSEAKKKPHHDPTPLPDSKHTQSVIQYEEKKIAKVASNLTFETEVSDIESIAKDIRKQDITVDVQIRPPSQVSLTCPNKHEYYAGSTIGKTPHGHGRFYNCCSSVPLVVPEGVEFYTGGFCKGKFQGYGTLTTKEGVKFVGNFRDGLKHGEGSLFYRGKVEIARWANDKFISNI